jgi:RHS repeat-associated protein
LKWDYACYPSATFEVQQSTDSLNWSAGSGTGILSDNRGNEQTMWPISYPVGTTIYYKVKAVVGSDESAFSAPVAAKVIPYDATVPAPPEHLDAHYVSGVGVKLHWCPNPPEDAVAGYRIYRATQSGGPYTIVRSLEVNEAWTDSDPALDPENQWYYYVLTAIKNPGSNELVSPFSNENVAGHVDPIPGSPDHPFDPDSIPDHDDAGWWDWYCPKDYVLGPAPSSLELLSQGRSGVGAASTPACESAAVESGQQVEEEVAPYRVVGIAASFHYTYYHLDHLGTPRVLTNSNGFAVQNVHLLPFGEEMPVEPGVNNRKFTGHERDAETGLDYMIAREYSPSTARFDRSDSSRTGFKPALVQSWNRYAYVRNSPVSLIDPTGKYDVTPYLLGAQWASGLGPREQSYDGCHGMTQTLAKHSYIESARELLKEQIRSGEIDTTQGVLSYDRGLGGPEGVVQYASDYSSVADFGLTGNLAAAYLGSYELTLSILYVDDRTGEYVVEFFARNDSQLSSLLHPPLLGYTAWWQNNIEPWIKSHSPTWGPGSKTTQYIWWVEYIVVEEESKGNVSVRCEGANC